MFKCIFEKFTAIKAWFIFACIIFTIITLFLMENLFNKINNELNYTINEPLNTILSATTVAPKTTAPSPKTTTPTPKTTTPAPIVNKDINFDEIKSKFEGVSLNISRNNADSTTGLYPIIQNNLTGYINSKGEVVVKCMFDEVFELNNLLFGATYTDVDKINQILTLYFIELNGECNKILEIEVKKIESEKIQEIKEMLKIEEFKINEGKNIFFLNEICNENNTYFTIVIDYDIEKSFTYDVFNKKAYELNKNTKITYYETVDRNICTNLLGEYWLEDKNSNKIGDTYNAFVNELRSENESPKNYLFIKNNGTSYSKYKNATSSFKDKNTIDYTYYNLILTDKDGEIILNSETFALEDGRFFAKGYRRYHQKYFNIINTNNLIIYKSKEYREVLKEDYMGSPLIGRRYLKFRTQIINKNLINETGKPFYEIALYLNESDNTMVTGNNDWHYDYEGSKLLDFDFNLINKFDIIFQDFLPLYKNNEIYMYLGLEGEKAYVFDNNMNLITSFFYENEKGQKFGSSKDASYFNIDNQINPYINENSIIKSGGKLQGLALYTLSNHGINLVDYLFFSNQAKRDYIYDDAKDIIGLSDERYDSRTVLDPYDYGVYDLKSKKHIFLSDNYLKFYNLNMIRTSDWSYTNIKGDKIYNDQSINENK